MRPFASLPSRLSIRSNAPGIEEHTRVLQQPRGYRMGGWEVLPNPGLEAQLERPVEPTDNPDTHLDASIGLGVVGHRILLLDIDEALVHL